MKSKIYTRVGDAGDTSLFGGKRVAKDHHRIDAYGTIDELNSILGVCRSMNTTREVDLVLGAIQSDLFKLGADLATPKSAAPAKTGRIGKRDIRRLERQIDRIDKQLPALRNFILPGGNRTASLLHFSRTVCRRGERLVVTLARLESVGPDVVIYLNRLGDLLFVLARWVNAVSNTPETIWKP